MLKRMHVAVIAAIRAFRAAHQPELILPSRPAWDNGTNYDVPTFVRRGLIK